MKLDPDLTLRPKINSEWIIDLNVNAIGKNMGANLCNVGLDNGFLDMAQEA